MSGSFSVSKSGVTLSILSSTRLAADLKVQLGHDGLDRLRGARMLLRLVEYHGQDQGTGVLLERHPLIGEHHARAAVHLHDMMIILHQLLRLLARADRNRLIGVDLIEIR